MKVCKIWDAEYPWDVRVEKVASALTNAGHEVHLIARNRDGRALEERLPECTVHRLAPLQGVGRRLSGASMFPAFCNPRWVHKIREVARRIDADIILCRDVPLTPTAVFVGRQLGIPVVLDMAENYPAMIRTLWESGRQRRSDWLVRNPAAVGWVERWCVRHVDHILVVVEESRDRLIRMGVPAERLTVVSNTPALSRLDEFTARPAFRTNGHRAAPLEVVYLGNLEVVRGIATLIDAVALCREAGLPVRLTLLGTGRDRALFEVQARRRKLDDTTVQFRGYVPYSEIQHVFQRADVGAIPHHVNESWNTTIPNKLFDYMAAGIAVLSSNTRPVERIVRATGCGEIFRNQDPQDAVRALIRLSDRNYRERCAVAGRAAIAQQYHWDREAERLVETIEQVTAGRAWYAGNHPAPSLRGARGQDLAR